MRWEDPSPCLDPGKAKTQRVWRVWLCTTPQGWKGRSRGQRRLCCCHTTYQSHAAMHTHIRMCTHSEHWRQWHLGDRGVQVQPVPRPVAPTHSLSGSSCSQKALSHVSHSVPKMASAVPPHGCLRPTLKTNKFWFVPLLPHQPLTVQLINCSHCPGPRGCTGRLSQTGFQCLVLPKDQ